MRHKNDISAVANGSRFYLGEPVAVLQELRLGYPLQELRSNASGIIEKHLRGILSFNKSIGVGTARKWRGLALPSPLALRGPIPF